MIFNGGIVGAFKRYRQWLGIRWAAMLRQQFLPVAQLQRQYLDPTSLQCRLTLEIAALLILSLSGIAGWTHWQMQQILIATHTQQVAYIASRFPQDVELYSEMLPMERGLEKTIENVSVSGLMIWVRARDGQLLAQSPSLQSEKFDRIDWQSLRGVPRKPQVYQVGNQHLILYMGALIVHGQDLGKLYLAKDVTQDQRQLMMATQRLGGVCLGVTVVMVVVLSLRIQRSLQPLQKMSQMAGAISAADLSQARLQLQNAPREVRELAQTFNRMLSRLADAWEQQRQVVSNISHELRTPLTIVLGYLQSLLRRSANLSDYQREALTTATTEAEQATRLLQDLLDLARADSGYMHFHRESVVLMDLVTEVAAMAEQFSDRAIQVSTSETLIAPETLKVSADRHALKRGLVNLIDNAVKYSAADQPVVLSLQFTETQAMIQVGDRGVGISLADQSRIFDRFYRVDEARSRATGGHGLGLAIAKTLIEGMEGSITVRSRLGEGSTFTITLPREVTI